MIGPSPSLVPSTPRQVKRARRTAPRHARGDVAVEPRRVDRPIGPADVRRIASKGYPLWESIEAMQLRNRRITVAYGDLANRLATLIAGGDERRDANWCCFACWSSKSVGTWIEKDAVPEPLRQQKGIARFMLGPVIALSRWLIQRGNGATYRCLAAGNRFVFLEMGSAIALFLEEFGDVDRDGRDDAQWSRYWDRVERVVAELSQLDPSWLLTDPPPCGDLKLGLRQYYEALLTSDPDERAELVLAGNILTVSYEQRRLQGYVTASLALFTKRAMRNLVRHRSGAVTGLIHGWLSTGYSRLMTRGLVLNTCEEQLKVGHPLPAPADPPGSPLFPSDLETITNPLLQALLTRYDLSEGNPRRRLVRDWCSYEDRMSYITNLFRSRQQRPRLFTPPFPHEIERALLEGRLAPGSASRNDPGPSGTGVGDRWTANGTRRRWLHRRTAASPNLRGNGGGDATETTPRRRRGGQADPDPGQVSQ